MRISPTLVSRGPRLAAWILLGFLLVFGGLLFAQQEKPSRPAGAAPSKTQGKPAGQAPAGQPQENINEEFGVPLAEESRQAAGEAQAGSQEKMIEELKHSPSVNLMSRLLHVSPFAGYWIGIILDFAILALLIIWGLRKFLPSVFRARTAGIQQAIAEARRASEDAARRLSEIESKLAKLGDEISALQSAAEQEADGEAQRIKAAAEQEKQHILEAADAEITAVTRSARRELKAFAADLAVSLAERRIRVDEPTDQALVRSFTHKLAAGKDGN